MPILFGIFGLILVVAGVRGRVASGDPSLVSLLKDDFSGSDPFWKWMLAILFVGSLGYIPDLKPVSRSFLVLVILVFFINNKGIFAQLQSTFQSNSNAGVSSVSNPASTINPLTGSNSVNPEDTLLQSINAFGIGK